MVSTVLWRKANELACAAEDDSAEENALYDEAGRLSILLATTPAKTPDDLIAQIKWFREDLGDYIEGIATKEHDKIFDTLLQGVATTSDSNVPKAAV